ncbi:TonB-dependent receptor [Marivirga arenosa]|uniref:Carboxypeptidase-like regulatory domain-containing protein n=1 Tax=Marivirga arenosa TaxID=3059076 RepID=A0AA51X448_9BACT|nr:TonB-dependent receptor [Marivirga sp. BKB1-2]WNB17207.1 carboxypeptidase-like regulatory domain-containing protein [Marivirga sp. BKB1-2]
MKFFQLSLFLVVSSLSAFAHISIQGRIISDEDQQALYGATIQVKGTQTGTTTDQFGYFDLSIDAEKAELIVQYIGYETQIIEVQRPNEELIIKLQPTSLMLSEISVQSSNIKSINQLAKIDVELRPVNSSQEILRYVPGLFIAQHAGGGKAEQIFLRGFDIDHGTDISISVDGKPVNMVSHAHGQGYADMHFVIPEIIESVDFGKGTYYADQGNFNTAGYVDFRTKNKLDKSMVKVEGGQFNTVRSVAAIDLLGEKGNSNNQSAYIAGEFMLTDGPFESPQNFYRYNLFGKYNQLLNANRMLTLQASTFRSEWDHSGQIPIRAVEQGLIGRFGAIDDTEGGITGRTDISATLDEKIGEKTYLENNIYFTQYDFELYSNFTFFLEDPINGDQIKQKEERSLLGYQSKLHHEGRLMGYSFNTSAGIGFRHDKSNGNELTRTVNRRTNLERLAFGDITESNAFAYINESWQINRLLINAGVRLDYFKFNYIDNLQTNFVRQSEQKSIISPKLNFNYQVNSNWNLYLKSGTGFHSNDTRVMVAQNGDDILPRAYGADFGSQFKPFDNLIVDVTAWYLFLEQEFVYVGDAAVVEPSGRTERKGIDLSARYQILPWLYADADFNYTEPRSIDEAEGENYIPLAPIYSGVGGLTFKHNSGINGTFRARYLGDRPANEDFSETAVGYIVADANINYSTSKFEIGIMVDNIFNVDWREAQFDTESRLPFESDPVSEVHFTPGTPFFLRAKFSLFF